MWVLFGSKTKAKPVPGGHEVQKRCRKCQKVTQHIECDITDALHVFFIELADSTQRRMVCTGCGEDSDVEQQPKTKAASQAPPRQPDPATARGAKDGDVDSKLTELKERMRREGKLR